MLLGVASFHLWLDAKQGKIDHLNYLKSWLTLKLTPLSFCKLISKLNCKKKCRDPSSGCWENLNLKVGARKGASYIERVKCLLLYRKRPCGHLLLNLNFLSNHWTDLYISFCNSTLNSILRMIEGLVLMLVKVSVSLPILPCILSSHQWNDSDKVSQHLCGLIFVEFYSDFMHVQFQ